MRKALYPGSFDPVTVGHLDIIRRAAAQFERVVVGVLHNPQKASGAFSIAERIQLLEEVTRALSNVEVQALSGLLVDAVAACGADGVVRGLRGSADTETEMQMARLNRQMSGVETVFFAAAPDIMHISASMVREIGRYGGTLAGMVPEALRQRIERALSER